LHCETEIVALEASALGVPSPVCLLQCFCAKIKSRLAATHLDHVGISVVENVRILVRPGMPARRVIRLSALALLIGRLHAR
jgi:hypothetical protein